MNMLLVIEDQLRWRFCVVALLCVTLSVAAHGQNIKFGCEAGNFENDCSLEELMKWDELAMPLPDPDTVPSITVYGTVFNYFDLQLSNFAGSLGPHSAIRVLPNYSRSNPGLIFIDEGVSWNLSNNEVTLNKLFINFVTPRASMPALNRRIIAVFGDIFCCGPDSSEWSSIFIKDRLVVNDGAPPGFEYRNEAAVQCFADEMPECQNTTRWDTPENAWLKHDAMSGIMDFNLIAEPGGGTAELKRFIYRLDVPFSMCSGGLVCGLPDMNGNGSPEIAALIVDMVSQESIVHIRDGFTGDPISTVNFGAVTVKALNGINDISGNGAPELAAMAELSNGQVLVQVIDALTDKKVKNVFYGTLYSGVDMAILPDTDGNGADELVVVGATISGAVRVQARDPLTSVATSTTYYGNKAVPVSVAVVPDVTGNGAAEMVMHGIVTASNQSRSQMRDSVSGQVKFNLFYGDFYVPTRVSTIGDLTGDGIPELAELAVAASGAARVKVKNPATGDHVLNAFIGNDPPIAVVGIEDANTDGVRDFAVLVNFGGVARVSRWDGVTGDFIDNVFFATAGVPKALTYVGDVDGNGEHEFAVFGNDAGQDRVKLKNTIEGTGVNDIDFP